MKEKLCALECQPEKADFFKTSNDWFYLCCERHNARFRKRKTGKQHSGECYFNKILSVSAMQ